MNFSLGFLLMYPASYRCPMEQVNIQIDGDEKSRWKDAVAQSPEYNSLTHLIQLSVIRELQRDNSDGGDVDLSPVHDRLDTVANQIEEVSQGVSDIRVSVRDNERKSQLRNKILDELRTEVTLDGFESGVEVSDSSPDVDDPGPMTAREIADSLNEPIERVEPELDWLVDNYGMVEKVDVQGATVRYVRTDQTGGGE